MPEIVKAQLADAGHPLRELVAAVKRGAVRRAARLPREDARIGVEVGRSQPQKHIVNLRRHRHGMDALALRQPVAADIGEAASHDDRALLEQHGAPAQAEQLRAAKAAERGDEDDGAGKAGLRAGVSLLHKELKDNGVHAASVQVAGAIAPDTPFAPDTIAETSCSLHTQPTADWNAETVFDGQQPTA
jgi:hypothetical protein